MALIDTGAETSALDTSVVAKLRAVGAKYITVTPSNAPALGGWGLAPVLLVRLALTPPQGPPLVERNVLVQELPIGRLGYDVLVGRDVLRRCDFHYLGRTTRFELTC